MLVELDELENIDAFIKAIDDVRRAYKFDEMVIAFTPRPGRFIDTYLGQDPPSLQMLTLAKNVGYIIAGMGDSSEFVKSKTGKRFL